MEGLTISKTIEKREMSGISLPQMSSLPFVTSQSCGIDGNFSMVKVSDISRSTIATIAYSFIADSRSSRCANYCFAYHFLDLDGIHLEQALVTQAEEVCY